MKAVADCKISLQNDAASEQIPIKELGGVNCNRSN